MNILKGTYFNHFITRAIALHWFLVTFSFFPLQHVSRADGMWNHNSYDRRQYL